MAFIPTGHSKGWYELDLLQEHHNRWIKRIFNVKNAMFGSKFLQNVSINIRAFGDLRQKLLYAMGLVHTESGRSHVTMKNDIEALARNLLDDDVLLFCASRQQPFSSADALEKGFNKLAGGQLDIFLTRTTMNVGSNQES